MTTINATVNDMLITGTHFIVQLKQTKLIDAKSCLQVVTQTRTLVTRLNADNFMKTYWRLRRWTQWLQKRKQLTHTSRLPTTKFYKTFWYANRRTFVSVWVLLINDLPDEPLSPELRNLCNLSGFPFRFN